MAYPYGPLFAPDSGQTQGCFPFSRPGQPPEGGRVGLLDVQQHQVVRSTARPNCASAAASPGETVHPRYPDRCRCPAALPLPNSAVTNSISSSVSACDGDATFPVKRLVAGVLRQQLLHRGWTPPPGSQVSNCGSTGSCMGHPCKNTRTARLGRPRCRSSPPNGRGPLLARPSHIA